MWESRISLMPLRMTSVRLANRPSATSTSILPSSAAGRLTQTFSVSIHAPLGFQKALWRIPESRSRQEVSGRIRPTGGFGITGRGTGRGKGEHFRHATDPGVALAGGCRSAVDPGWLRFDGADGAR